jgi:glutamate-1-semialdehyde 2,1-aminomutase
MERYKHSIDAFTQACKSIPGGVNSPARAFRSVNNDPVFIKKASGAYITDIDNNTYIDYVGSWGPMILGHAFPEVIDTLNHTLMDGTSYGAPTLLETAMAEQIKKMVPSVDKVRMVNSGTEATMSALRLARGYTGRDLIVKFEGCYHGHGDSFLIQAGSGALTLGTPNSPGVTKGTAADTLVAVYNDLGSVETLFRQYGERIAAIILEPVTGNMGVVLPKPGFLQGIRELCNTYKTVLVFDEVMTGFRLAKGGAQEIYNVTPDLTTFGKIIGGGLPVGAYGGREDIMNRLAPDGPVYQAGTLSGNPMAMAAGLTTLKILEQSETIYSNLEKKARQITEGLEGILNDTGVAGKVNRQGSMFTLFFTSSGQVASYKDVMTSDTQKFAAFFNQILQGGIYFPPSQFEAVFISNAHSDDDIERTLEVCSASLKEISREG